jgi:hypothetical protein
VTAYRPFGLWVFLPFIAGAALWGLWLLLTS